MSYRRLIALLSLFLACTFTLHAQNARFYRIISSDPSSEPADILEFRSDGMLVWSNPVPGVAGFIQFATKLAEGGDWAYLLEFSEADEIMSGHVVGNPDIPEGMVLIPGGTNSGTNPDSGLGEYSLTVDSFYMDKYPVTKALWDDVYTWAIAHGYSFTNRPDGSPPGRGKAADHPVQTVSWYDAVKWCNARSEMEGKTPAYYTSTNKTEANIYRTDEMEIEDGWVRWDTGYRLPTETEWEYAARGGVSSRRFPWGDTDTIQHARANYVSSSSYSYDTSSTRGYHPVYNIGGIPYTSPVGSFAANGYGLYDMAGNVWEWCFTASGSHRVGRGGSWFTYANICRVGGRIFGWPAYDYGDAGFRAVLPLIGSEEEYEVITISFDDMHSGSIECYQMWTNQNIQIVINDIDEMCWVELGDDAVSFGGILHLDFSNILGKIVRIEADIIDWCDYDCTVLSAYAGDVKLIEAGNTEFGEVLTLVLDLCGTTSPDRAELRALESCVKEFRLSITQP